VYVRSMCRVCSGEFRAKDVPVDVTEDCGEVMYIAEVSVDVMVTKRLWRSTLRSCRCAESVLLSLRFMISLVRSVSLFTLD
jgi:hypothetical protein